MTLSFEEVGRNFELNKVIQSYGLEKVRNKIAAVYLSRIQDGHFCSLPDMSLIDYPLSIEKEVIFRSASGHHRGFLLGLYMQMAQMKGHELNLEIDATILKALKMSNGKMVKVDLMIIILCHLKEFLGEEKLLQLLDQGGGHQKVFSQLSSDQHQQMAGNILSYCASIDEKDFLTIPIM